jgi:membrane fusion protein
VALLIFLAFRVEYAPSQSVLGRIRSGQDPAKIVALEPGTVTEVRKEMGDVVRRGDVLMVLDRSIGTRGLLTVESSYQQQIDAQTQATEAQAAMRIRAAEDRAAWLQRKIASLRAEAKVAEEEIQILQSIATSSNHRALAFSELVGSGFISSHAASEKKDEASSAKAKVVAAQSNLLKIERELGQASNDHDHALIEVSSTRSQVLSDLARLEGEKIRYGTRESLIKAPTDGVIQAVHAAAGQSVVEGSALATIARPSSVNQQAELELFIPNRALANVKVGQKIFVSIDAYPREKFGVFEATVTAISNVAMSLSEVAKHLGVEPRLVFVAKAVLSQTALGLESGMTVKADIQVERRSIIEWILEPALRQSAVRL